MPKPYSGDLRARVIEEIVTGASRREAAERYGISARGDLGAAVRSNWERRGKAEWRQHISAGRARGISASLDCCTTGPDAGRGRCGDGAARDRGQPQRRLAFLRSPQHQLQKKLCTPRSKSARKWSTHAGGGCASKACLTRPDWFLSTKRRRTRAWCGFEVAVRAGSD